jgi:hypothetical protein
MKRQEMAQNLQLDPSFIIFTLELKDWPMIYYFVYTAAVVSQ